jgi:hypothetical protein
MHSTFIYAVTQEGASHFFVFRKEPAAETRFKRLCERIERKNKNAGASQKANSRVLLQCRRKDSNLHPQLRGLGPEPSASANSATSARRTDYNRASALEKRFFEKIAILFPGDFCRQLAANTSHNDSWLNKKA